MNRTGFEKLRIYQLAEELADTIWNMVSKWNFFAQDTVGKQLVSAADSIGANLAEGSGRESNAEKKHFARIARGSLFEVKHWLRRAYNRNLITESEVQKLQSLINELTPKISAYINAFGRKKEKKQPTKNNPQITTHNPLITFLCFLIILLLSLLPFSSSLAETLIDSAEADFIPWSGYWWPTNRGGLATGSGYRGHPAPIEKYELLVKGSYPRDATLWELENNYDPNAPHWYGLCHAWSSAAVTENIDFKPSSYENIIFYVGDKKGLITACHGSDIKEIASASEPQVFHQWLLYYIKDNGLAFVGELEPSEEFWSYPIYRYSMEITENGSRMSVSCRIWYADDFVDPDFQGTKALSKVYTYDLYLNEEGEITSGEWTGQSSYDHPGLIWRPISPVPTNPYLDYEIIKQIAESRDDDFEGNEPSTLSPGSHNLVLMDEDKYRIECNEGDTVFLSLEKVDNLSEGITFKIEDQDGEIVHSSTVLDREEFSFFAETPPYMVTISRGDYGEGGVYNLKLDLKTEFEFVIPKIQKGGAWLGMAITNGGDLECKNVYIVGYQEDGEVISTLKGPFSLSAGEKKTMLLSDLPVRKHEESDLCSIKFLAGSPLQVLSLNGNYDQNLSCFSGMRKGSFLIIPEVTGWTNYQETIWWGISNQGENNAEINLKLYSREGLFLEEESETIPPYFSLSYTSSGSPFHSSADDGWVMIEGNERDNLAGYVLWFKDRFEKGESLFALNRRGNRFFIPHLAYNELWKTALTLINLSDQENAISLTLFSEEERKEATITLNPFEKREIDVKELFSSVDPGILKLSSLCLESQKDMTGLFSYETSSTLAYLPLLSEEDVHQEVIVPHVASNDYWWTGVGIFNPNDDPVILSISPYDRQGKVMVDQVKVIILNGQEKEVFCAGDLFDPSWIGDISFLKISSVYGSGIAGLYLYGDRGFKVLAGAVMGD
jgi:four helix bundle protein